MVTMEFTDAQRKALHDGAVRAYNTGRGLLELADCQQEAYLWAYENVKLVQEWEEKDKRHEKLKSAAYHAGLALIRATMRANGGSKPQDFATYATAAVQDLLPTIFMDATFQTGHEVNDEIHHKKIPSEGGVGLAMVADMKAAFIQLPPDYKTILFDLYGPHIRSYEEIATDLDCSAATVRRRETRALEEIIDALGGPRQEFKQRRKVSA